MDCLSLYLVGNALANLFSKSSTSSNSKQQVHVRVTCKLVLALYFHSSLNNSMRSTCTLYFEKQISPHPMHAKSREKVPRERHLFSHGQERKWERKNKNKRTFRYHTYVHPITRRTPFRGFVPALSHDHFISLTRIHFPVYQDSGHLSLPAVLAVHYGVLRYYWKRHPSMLDGEYSTSNCAL